MSQGLAKLDMAYTEGDGHSMIHIMLLNLFVI